MSATAAQVARLRRLVSESSTDTYSDATLAEYIERYPLLDERGEEPYTWDTSTQPPTQDDNDDWIATYDLHAAAGDIWEEKAGAEAAKFNFSADGGSYSMSQKYQQMMAQARYHRARRSPTTATLIQWPKVTGTDYVVNRIPDLD